MFATILTFDPSPSGSVITHDCQEQIQHMPLSAIKEPQSAAQPKLTLITTSLGKVEADHSLQNPASLCTLCTPHICIAAKLHRDIIHWLIHQSDNTILWEACLFCCLLISITNGNVFLCLIIKNVVALQEDKIIDFYQALLMNQTLYYISSPSFAFFIQLGPLFSLLWSIGRGE